MSTVFLKYEANAILFYQLTRSEILVRVVYTNLNLTFIFLMGLSGCARGGND